MSHSHTMIEICEIVNLIVIKKTSKGCIIKASFNLLRMWWNSLHNFGDDLMLIIEHIKNKQNKKKKKPEECARKKIIVEKPLKLKWKNKKVI